jgi:D-alanine-D-alanine ligase
LKANGKVPKPAWLAADFGRVAVCAGGDSAEREISLRSGAAVAEALQAAGIDVQLVDLDKQFFEQAVAGKFDRVFIAIHGRGGEDGALQGFLDLIGLPYTGSRAAASVLGMDKQLTKLQWQAAGLPTPAWRMVASLTELAEAAEAIGLPVMVKPVGEGSSIGMSLVEQEQQFEAAWLAASATEQPVMVEQYVVGNEYTAAMVLDQQLPLVRITTPRKFYDYEAKYVSDETGYHCPAGLAPAAEEQLADLAARAFAAIGGGGWGRVDLLVDESGVAWLIEVNTVPGLTDHSLVPMAARVHGWDFGALALAILSSSMTERAASAAEGVAHG